MLPEPIHFQSKNRIAALKTRPPRLSLIAMLPFLIVVAALNGCSRGRSEKAAIEALNQSFKHDPLVLRLYIGRVGSQCTPIVGLVRTPDLTSVVEYRAAQKSGLINIAQDGPGFWKVSLISPSPKLAAALAKAPHIMKGGCDDQSVALPVASRAVVDLVSLQPVTSEKSAAIFTWKWTLEPDGVKLVDNLSDQERLELAPQIERVNPLLRQSSFNLGDMTASTEPHQDKATLKKSGDGWAIDK